jgi:hypothetical protein
MSDAVVMRLGKLPAQPDIPTLKLAHYAVALPVPTAVFGFGGLYTDWGMLGNDQYGDCVFAGASHETMLWNKLRGGVDVPMSTKTTLEDYTEVTGFNPKNPSTDNGAYMIDALKYRRATGVRDASEGRHKIAAYLQLKTGDFAQAIQAAFVFGAVGMGFEVPATIWDQFDNGEYWDVTDPNADIIGGHYVPIVGSRNSLARATVLTWGRRQQLTKRFYETYNDESYVMLSEEQIRSDGKGIHGLNLTQLQADLAAL